MITARDLSSISLFASLDEPIRERIAARAADHRVGPGEWFTREGDVANFWALLEGEVEALKLVGGSYRQATTFDVGEYFGEVPLMIGATVTIGMRAIAASRLVRIDAADFHALVAESDAVAAELAKTLARRVTYISEHIGYSYERRATIVGDAYDARCHEARDFLARNQIVFGWLDPSVASDLPSIPQNVVDRGEFPVVLLADGTQLVCPTKRELANALALSTKAVGGLYDVAIVGGGPAGLAAGVYGGSEGLRTLLVEREATGGQAGTSSRIENYLGFPGGVSGDDLALRALQQAERFGTEILITQCVTRIDACEEVKVLGFDDGEIVEAKTLVIASGVRWRSLDIPGADRFNGRGLYYGAARTEALGTRGQDVFLIGGGNSAGQAAMYFSDFARSVTLLVRGPNLERTMSFYLIEQLRSKANISVETSVEAIALEGADHLESIVTRTADGQRRTRSVHGLFAFIGADAETAWLPSELERDARGYLRTGRDLERWSLATRAPYQFETNIPGVFAVGDVRSNSVKRVASAVGEGSIVISYVHEYIETQKREASSDT